MRSTRNQPNPTSSGIIWIVIILIAFVAFFVLSRQPDLPVQTLPVSPASQQSAIQRLADESGKAVNYSEDNGVIRQLSFEWAAPQGQDPQQAVYSLLTSFPDIFNISDPTNQLRYLENKATDFGNSAIIFSQNYQGIPVYGSQLVFNFSSQGVLDFYSGGYIPDLSIDINPRLQANEVQDIIRIELGDQEIQVSEVPQLFIYDPRVFGTANPGGPKLIWYQEVLSEQDYAGYFIDAIDGKIISKTPLLKNSNELRFEIYDAHQYLIPELIKYHLRIFDNPKRQNEPTLIYTHEGQKGLIVDPEGKKISHHINTVYDYFAHNFNWYSYDEVDSPIKIYVNATLKESEDRDDWVVADNAFWWNGVIYFTDKMVGSVDILAHEFTHGVTEKLIGEVANIENISEPMALIESFSDIFAAFIDKEHPWKICKDDCEDNPVFYEFNDDFIRNLEDPHNTNNIKYPKHYDERVFPGEGNCVDGEADYGCGHINSTIHSHAVYLFSKNIGLNKSSQIIFNAFKSRLITPNTDFSHARQVIVLTCKAMTHGYGVDIEDCRQIELAYDQVGIKNPWEVVIPKDGQQTTNSTPQTPTIPTGIQIASQNTETILLVDTSTSMEENDIGGTQKMAAAQHAAGNLLEVISSEQQAAGGTFRHQVGLVSFSSSAEIIHSMTTETLGVKASIEQLFPSGNTAMAAGLQEAIGSLDASSSSNRMIVLLSDGVPTVGLDGGSCLLYCSDEDRQSFKQDVLEVAREAKSKNICIHTVGFGDPSAESNSNEYIDEDFLRQVAAASGCGQYYGAQESIQLANAFVELRHNAMGSLLLQDSGQISQGETLALGAARVPGSQGQLMLTINWPGSQIIPLLVDPRGKTVDVEYPGAVIIQGDSLATILVDRPAAGDWQLSIIGQDVPKGSTAYNALISTRGNSTIQQTETTPWLWFGLGGLLLIVGLIALNPRQRSAAVPRQGGPIPQSEKPDFSAFLIGNVGELKGKRVWIGRGGLIGRGPRCQLVIRDPSVSREHARLYFSQGRWFIQDMGSSSGTFINEQRVKNAILRDGVTIRLGRSTFTFHER